MQGALPTFPRLHAFNYLSLISQSFWGLFRIAVTAAAAVGWWWLSWMLKDGDQRERWRGFLQPLWEMLGLREKGPLGVWVSSKRSREFSKMVACFTSLLSFFSSSVVGFSLSPHGRKWILGAVPELLRRARTSGSGLWAIWGGSALVYSGFFYSLVSVMWS